MSLYVSFNDILLFNVIEWILMQEQFDLWLPMVPD